MYDLTQIEVIMLTSFMDITHEKYTNNGSADFSGW